MPSPAKVVCARKPRAATRADARPFLAAPSGTATRSRVDANARRLAVPGGPAPFNRARPAVNPVPGLGVGRTASPVPVLVRRLIAETSGRGATPARPPSRTVSSPEAVGRSILLDVEVDGVRCLLVRLPRPTLTPGGAPVGGGGVCLSPREREITRLIAQGYPNKAIADVLDISAWTVCTHLRRIFGKFNVSSRAAMVARFLKTENSAGAPV